MNETTAMINKYDPAILRTLTVTSPRFTAFQARVRALPPAPPTKR